MSETRTAIHPPLFPIVWSGDSPLRPIFPPGGMMPTNDDARVILREELVETVRRAYCPCEGELRHTPDGNHPHGHRCRACGQWFTLSNDYPQTRTVA